MYKKPSCCTIKHNYFNSIYDDDTKTIRLNANLIALFKFANKESILDDVYPTVSAYITEDKFKELYEHATEEPHNALVIDGTGSKILFKKNFDKLLKIN